MPADRKGKSRALPGDANGESQDFLALDIDGDRGESGVGGDGYQQMQLVEQQVSRSHGPGPAPISPPLDLQFGLGVAYRLVMVS